MEYKLSKSSEKDINRLIEYKKQNNLSICKKIYSNEEMIE